MIIYYFFIILATFLQTVSQGIWWPALIVIWAAGKREAGQVYTLAFVGGLATDLLTGRSLGTTSIMLLILAAAVVLFRSRFRFRLRWLIIFIVLAEGLYHFLVY